MSEETEVQKETVLGPMFISSKPDAAQFVAGMDIKNIVQQLQNIAKERDKLLHLRTNYISHAKILQELGIKAKELSEEIISIARKIDPVLTLSPITRQKHIKHGTITILAREMYEKMVNGMHVTRELVENAYPDLTEAQHGDILAKIAILSGVIKVKDGHRVRLFCRKG